MRVVLTVLAAGLLAGCVHQQKIDVASGVADELAKRAATTSARACPVRLAALDDARMHSDRAGVAAGMDASLADPLPLLEKELDRVGIRRDAAGAPDLRVVLKRLYINQTLTSKTPTVVLAHTGVDGVERIVRGQNTTLLWDGSPDEYYKGMAVALRLAVDQLAADVDAHCAGS